jgi:hypothetical protein
MQSTLYPSGPDLCSIKKIFIKKFELGRIFLGKREYLIITQTNVSTFIHVECHP